jgi:hypothetical protein
VNMDVQDYVEAIEDVRWNDSAVDKGDLLTPDDDMVLANPTKFKKTDRKPGDIDPNQVFVEALEEVHLDPPGEQGYWAIKGALVPDDNPMVSAFPDKFRKTDRRPDDAKPRGGVR